MAVTEGEMLFATQIAYADLDDAFGEITNTNGSPVYLIDAITQSYNKSGGENLWDNFSSYLELDNGKPTYDEYGNLKFKDEYAYISQWKLLATTNDNVKIDSSSGTGFCACILDTGEDRIVACRGSESISPENMNDWINDVRFLYSIQTAQDAKLWDFLNSNKALLEEKNWYATGHSLGGSLADYAAVLSVEKKISNFAGSINFDGPGRSLEFIDKYNDEIAQVCPKMQHKKASFVGMLLNDLPGVEQKYIEVSYTDRLTGEYSVISALTPFKYFLVHSTSTWVLDENHKTIEREPSSSDYAIEALSWLLDKLPTPVKQYLSESVVGTLSMVEWMGDFFGADISKKARMLAVFCVEIINDPSCIIEGITDVGITLVAAAGILIDIGIAKLADFVENVLYPIIKPAVDFICDGVEWLKGKAVDVFDAACEAVKKVGNWFNEHFNNDAEYTKEHPYFKADTDMLDAYASMLASVNSRLKSLDGDMRSLYWQVGFLDLWDILCANLITSESYSLNRAIWYLTDTAERLSSADSKARGYLEG